MPRVPIQFGTGLQRSAGHLAAPPDAMRDLRNVHPRLGRVLVRKGHTAKATFSASDHVLAILASRPDQAGIAVVQEATSGDIEVWRTDSVGDNEEFLANWFTLASQAQDPPRIIGTPAYRKVFLSHDEDNLGIRAATAYYDPAAGNYLTTLQADLDGNGDADVYFAGTCFWKDHLIGWGYGQPDLVQPDWIWVSLPGQPTVFDPEHYSPVGVEGEPVVRVIPGLQPIIFKPNSTHVLTGRYSAEFLVQDTDKNYGLASSRLAVLVGTTVYGWSLSGPRQWGPNGVSSGLEIPLDLDAPDPSGLVAEGAADEAWAEYDPEEELVIFNFGRRQYRLSVWNPQRPEWSYGELPLAARSAGILYDTGNNTAPAGEPQHNTTAQPTDTSLTVTVDHVSAVGDEYLEIWGSEDGGAYELLYSELVNGQSQEDVTLSGLTAGAVYDYSMRYRRGSRYNAGSTDPDPANWDADGQFTVVQEPDAPTLDSLAWQRVDASTEEVQVTFTPAYADYNVRVYRDGLLVATVTAATHGGSQYTYDDQGITGETDHDYELRTTTPTGDSDPTATQSIYTGPSAIPTIDTLTSPTTNEYNVAWSSGGGEDLEIHDNYAGGGATGSFALRNTVAAAGGSSLETLDASSSGVNVSVKVRAKETVAGTSDFGKFSAQDSVTIS